MLPLDYPGMDGVVFKLIAEREGTETILFEEWQRGRAWRERLIPLGDFAGERITLRWYVDSGPDWRSIADDPERRDLHVLGRKLGYV